MRKPFVVVCALLCAAGGATPAYAGPVTSADLSARSASPVQESVLDLVNERRRIAGCEPLTLDRRLTDAAGEHATDMARHGYFAHDSRNGDDAGDRVRDAGFRWRRFGENIARGANSPDQVVRDWMHSPAHRENILDCRLREMGIGVAVSPRRGAYWVQDFATS
jgi:uncharacterized protein YkwD